MPLPAKNLCIVSKIFFGGRGLVKGQVFLFGDSDKLVQSFLILSLWLVLFCSGRTSLLTHVALMDHSLVSEANWATQQSKFSHLGCYRLGVESGNIIKIKVISVGYFTYMVNCLVISWPNLMVFLFQWHEFHSLPLHIAVKARRDHQEALKLLELPSWQRTLLKFNPWRTKGHWVLDKVLFCKTSGLGSNPAAAESKLIFPFLGIVC